MSEERPIEIVIVRRKAHDDHDDAHGGVWKVAFADFMTAMMAFFLVLWIVNSTSKETRASVARYFNPVRLSDTTPARKGLQEPREEDFDASFKESDKKAAPEPPSAGKSEAEAGNPRKDALQTTSAEKNASLIHAQKEATFSIVPVAGAATSKSERFRDPFETAAVVRPVPDGAIKSEASAAGSLEMSSIGNAASVARALATLAQQIGARGGPAIDISETSEGTLINLTDRADFGMFPIGSTVPNSTLVRLIGEIGALLKPLHGQVVIRGHTDRRPFRAGNGDNWRLSTGRAQIVCDLLLRGGLEERRVEKVEGHADRSLRNPKDADAAENRRVEILLRKDGA